MPRKGHSEEQIVYALRQVEGGKKVSEVCRELGVSPQAFYRSQRTQGHVYIRSFLTHKEYDNPANWDRKFGTK